MLKSPWSARGRAPYLTVQVRGGQDQSGGNPGLLGLLDFDPAQGKIGVHTYSPILDESMTHIDHSDTLDYAFEPLRRPARLGLGSSACARRGLPQRSRARLGVVASFPFLPSLVSRRMARNDRGGAAFTYAAYVSSRDPAPLTIRRRW